ncbi:MAG: HamA C-terminal domain-containing protein [Mangrovicoccus sp.]
MSHPYKLKPACILKRLTEADETSESYCAGFELSEWRCDGLADNLMEWITDYALKSDELRNSNHTNNYVRLKQAATRVYISENYKRRGEVGEIAAHAICRTYFDTIPIAARVNYLSASNDPVKAFDLVHVRYVNGGDIELWLGEAKFFKTRSSAISDAITSIESHITAGFLKNEKLLLGPQVSDDIPHSAKIKELLASETSLDDLFSNAVFPVLIAANWTCHAFVPPQVLV